MLNGQVVVTLSAVTDHSVNHSELLLFIAGGATMLQPLMLRLTRKLPLSPQPDTEEPDRRRQETPHLSARRKGALLPASPGGPKKLARAATATESLRQMPGSRCLYR